MIIIVILLLIFILLENVYEVHSYLKHSFISHHHLGKYSQLYSNVIEIKSDIIMSNDDKDNNKQSILPCMDIVTNNIHLVGIIGKKKVITKSHIYVTIIPPRDSYPDGILDFNVWIGMSNSANTNPYKIKLVIDNSILGGDSRVKEINRQLKVGQKIYVSGTRTNVENDYDLSTIYISANTIRVLEDTELIIAKDVRKYHNDSNNVVAKPSLYPATTLDLPNENIIFVDDLSSLLDMKRILFDNTELGQNNAIETYNTSTKTSLLSIIGVDCEWKPENYFNRFKRSTFQSVPVTIDTDNDLNKSMINEKVADQKLGKRALATKLITRIFRFVWNPKNESIVEKSQLIPKSIEKLNPIEYRDTVKVLKEMSIASLEKNITKEEQKNIASPVALLQLATRQYVFVVDLQSICRQPEPGFGYMLADFSLTEKEKALDDILFKLFHSEDIIKIGLGPTQDFKRLAWSYPWIPSMLQYNAVIDIQTLAKRAFPSFSSKDLEGLSKLSIKLLGKSVDKTMQCSDWSVRPLSREQLDYASIDAHIQTKMFDILCFYSELSVLNTNDVIKNLCMNLVVSLPTAYKKSQKKKSLAFTGKPLPLKVMNMQATPMSNSFIPKSILPV